MILRKGRSPLFHCHQKQAHKKGDLNSKITFERVTDKYTDQRTSDGMRGRERSKEEIYNKTDTLMK